MSGHLKAEHMQCKSDPGANAVLSKRLLGLVALAYFFGSLKHAGFLSMPSASLPSLKSYSCILPLVREMVVDQTRLTFESAMLRCRDPDKQQIGVSYRMLNAVLSACLEWSTHPPVLTTSILILKSLIKTILAGVRIHPGA